MEASCNTFAAAISLPLGAQLCDINSALTLIFICMFSSSAILHQHRLYAGLIVWLLDALRRVASEYDEQMRQYRLEYLACRTVAVYCM